MGAIDKKLSELGITLPTPAAPVANYVPFVRTGNLLVVSGHDAHKVVGEYCREDKDRHDQ